MNGFDIAAIVITGIFVLVGVVQGLVRILVTLGALVVAFVVASRLHQPLADLWTGGTQPSAVLRLVAYLVIFFGVMLAGGVLAWLLRKLVKAALLGWADRLAGAALGLVAASLALALLILPVVAYTPKGETLLRGSVLAPYVTVVADFANRLAPDDLARRYHERIRELRERWRDRDVVRASGAGENARPRDHAGAMRPYLCRSATSCSGGDVFLGLIRRPDVRQ